MSIVLRVLISLVVIALGFYAMTHSYQLTRLMGYNDFAERYLGTGGTYSMWKLIGAVLVVGSLVYLFH